MSKYPLAVATEEAPLGSILKVWHQRSVNLRIKAVIWEQILDDAHTSKLVKESRLLTLFHLN